MKYSVAVAALVSLSEATLWHGFPLSNGFPNPPASQIPVIEHNAGGALPNAALPKSLGPNGVLDLQVIALQETFEVAYFTSLLGNLTDNVAGYETPGLDRDNIIADIFAIRAQEELHALGANAILESAGHEAMKPCQYDFQATSFNQAILLAETFTEVVVGTLQSVQEQLGAEGGAELTALVPLVGAIIGMESEQLGAFRVFEDKRPSAAPFLTNSVGVFAANALFQNFIVPGSCPNAPTSIPALKTLKVVAQPPAADSTVSFITSEACSTSDHVTFISGVLNPVTVPIQHVAVQGGMYTITVEWPFESMSFSKGLTIAALTSAGPFASNSAVADASMAGPGLIVVD